MTPKEKAKELVEKFSKIQLGETEDGLPFFMPIDEAKQCALIAVNEIFMLDINAKCESQFVIERKIEEYCQSVKEEIIKL